MGFLDKLLKKNNGQSTNFGKLVEKFGAGIKDTAEDLLEDGLGSVKGLLGGVGTSLGDLTKSKNDRNKVDKNNKNFHSKEVALANLHSDAILDILKGVGNGNLLSAGVNALQLYNYGTKWTIITDQYVDKDQYPFRYAYLAETSYGSGNLTESETIVAKRELLDSIEDPTILGYTVKFDFQNSPLFDLKRNTKNRSTAMDFVEAYRFEHPEMNECIENLKVVNEMCQQIFESGESLDGLSYQKNLKQHYILSIDGIQKLDNPFVDFKEDELKVTLNEDVRLYSNKLAFAYRNLSFSKAYGKKLIPENLLRFNMYIKISDQRSFTRNTKDSDPMRDAMRNAYSRIIYELKDCEMTFENSLPNEMTMGSTGSGSVDGAYAKVLMKIKYRKVNRIFYSSMFDKDFVDFIATDKFHIHDDSKSMDFLKETKFEDRRTSEFGDEASKRRATSNNMDVVPSLSSQYSELKNRGLFTTDDDDSAVTRFIKTLGNKAVQKGMTYVDEGLDKVENAIDKLGLSVRDKLQGLVQTSTVSLGNVNGGFVATTVSAPSVRDINTRSSYYNNGVGVIGLQNLATNPADVNPMYYQNLNTQRYYQNQQVIGLENLASDPATATEIYYRNLNSGRYYSNVGVIGLQNLSTDKVDIVPIRMENLAQDFVPVSPIAYNDLMVNEKEPVQAPIGDLMEGFAPTPGLTSPVDLMVADKAPVSIEFNDLMIADIVPAAITANDLMNADIVPVGLTSPVDLMVADITPAGLSAAQDLMIADIVPVGLTRAEDFMVADELAPTAPVGDLMVAESDAEAIKLANLMVSNVETSPIQAQDLMIVTSEPQEMPEANLMQPVDALESIAPANLMTGETNETDMTLENLMTPTPSENKMTLENLMAVEPTRTDIKFEDLMVADDTSTPMTPANLMVADVAPNAMELNDLMVADKQPVSIQPDNLMVVTDVPNAMPFEDLMVADALPAAMPADNLMVVTEAPAPMTADNLMRVDAAPADLSQIDNVNPVTGSGIQAPNVENLMQTDNFKKFLKKKE